jgi:glycosyltransferase involved in cell wall biosynthesis
MRIAVISSIYKKTPPDGYGGIERVVYTLTEELSRRGHDVVLFGARGSRCSGKTVEVTAYDPAHQPSGIKKGSQAISEEPLYRAMREYLEVTPVDVIHDWSFENLYAIRHPDAFPFVISTCIPPLPNYKRENLVACSRAHALLCGGSTRHVYYGLDLENWEYRFAKRPHLIHISKIARYKGQHLAIKAARKAGQQIVIAGNIEDRFYYCTQVLPLLWLSPKATYIGEIQGTKGYLRDATALVQTPRWFDAFPLVILEAFASGTPVIAFSEGGIPEQIVNGVNGFLCNTFDDLVSGMERIGEIKPSVCRSYAEERFSVGRMAGEYLQLYQRVMDGERW